MYQVVIAEDEFFVRLGIKSSVAWEENDMQVVCDVGNGADAWEFIRQNPPDILLTDLRMPQMDGEQLIENIAREGLNTYIIVITCLEEFRMVQKMMSFGVRDYLLKATMTEAEISASVLKAKQELDKKQTAVPSRPTQKQQLSSLLHSFLTASGQYDEVRELLLSRNIPEALFKHTTAVLGIIDDTNDALYNSEQAVNGNILQNLLEILEHDLSSEHCITLALDSQRFLMLLFSRSARAEIHEKLHCVRKESADYLNLRFSMLTAPDIYIEDLPAVYDRLTALSQKHYLHGSNSLISTADSDSPDIARICGPLNEYRDWFGEACGPSAAVRFQICLDNIAERSVISQEEMLYSLLNLTHLIGSYFDSPLEKLRRQCETTILNRPYLNDAVASLDLFLNACRQHQQIVQVSSRPEIRAILTYIHENLSDPELTLNAVARHVGLSETYLSSLFHAEVRQSFRKYLTHVRIETAKHLLEDTNEKIGNIALMTGFSDEGYFSRVFKKVTDVSPKDWRNL